MSEKVKGLAITEALAIAISNYLDTRPHGEVVHLIAALKAGVPVEMENKEVAKEVPGESAPVSKEDVAKKA